MVMPKSPTLPDRKTYASQDDVLEAVQAIRDNIEALIKERLDSTEAEMNFRLNKVLDKKISKTFDQDLVTKLTELRNHCDSGILQIEGRYGGWASELGNHYDKSLSEMKSEYEKKTLALAAAYGKSLEEMQEGYQQKILDLESRYEKRFSELEETYAKKLETINSLSEEKNNLLKSCLESGMEQIKALLVNISIPTPMVTVAAPNVTVESKVLVPESLPPVVNFNPEIKAGENVVNVPKPRLTRKVFEYYPDGRPASVEEFEKE